MNKNCSHHSDNVQKPLRPGPVERKALVLRSWLKGPKSQSEGSLGISPLWALYLAFHITTALLASSVLVYSLIFEKLKKICITFAPAAYGSSWAWGGIGAAATGLYYSLGNTGSKMHLPTTLQLVAMLDP